MLACNQFWPNGLNIDYYCNPALDALYNQELSTADQGARQNIFVQIHYIYLTQFPFIVLFGENYPYIVRIGIALLRLKVRSLRVTRSQAPDWLYKETGRSILVRG